MTQLFKEYRAGKVGGRYWIITGYWSIKSTTVESDLVLMSATVLKQMFGIFS